MTGSIGSSGTAPIPPPPPPPPPAPPPPSSDGDHVWLGMTFTAKEWQQLMKNIEKSVSSEIKRENAHWKREFQQERQMWSGN
ncbi:MAG: hypothetical protein WDZ28_04445 [Simkaniaceae bacterium]